MKKVNYVGKDIQLEDNDLLKSGMKLTASSKAVVDGVEAYEVECGCWETTYWLDKKLFNSDKE